MSQLWKFSERDALNITLPDLIIFNYFSPTLKVWNKIHQWVNGSDKGINKRCMIHWERTLLMFWERGESLLHELREEETQPGVYQQGINEPEDLKQRAKHVNELQAHVRPQPGSLRRSTWCPFLWFLIISVPRHLQDEVQTVAAATQGHPIIGPKWLFLPSNTFSDAL